MEENLGKFYAFFWVIPRRLNCICQYFRTLRLFHLHGLSINNKLLLHQTVIAPIWTYGLELWGCASKSNIAIIQRFQS